MDMKRILQAMEGIAIKPVAGVDSMAKFLRVVKEANLNQPTKEGIFGDLLNKSPEDIAKEPGPAGEMMKKLLSFKADPKYASNPQLQQQVQKRIEELTNRINIQGTIPVDATGKPKEVVPPEQFKDVLREGTRSPSVAEQMITKQYAQTKQTLTEKSVAPVLTGTLRSYYALVENENQQVANERSQVLNEHARIIAERVLVKERSTTEKQARTMAAAAHNPEFASKVGIDQKVAKEFNQKDKGTALLSNAMKGKKKAKKVKENEIPGHSMGFTGGVGPGVQSNEPTESTIKEANKAKRTLKNSNPCWDGYKPVGTKKKNGRTVPNCVPKN